MHLTPHLSTLQTLWDNAIDAVAGEQSTINAIQNNSPFQPDLIIAVGKASCGMCLGALKALGQPGSKCPAIVVTKYDHADDAIKKRPHITVYETAHPIPDDNSLHAGQAITTAVKQLSRDSKLLLLVSGGASALAEHLIDRMTLDELQTITNDMLSNGLSIEQINKRRKQLSQIKDGKLLKAFKGEEVRVYAISDVEGDDINVIGSGLGDCKYLPDKGQARIIASNQQARHSVANSAKAMGWTIITNEETLYDDVFLIADKIGATLKQFATTNTIYQHDLSSPVHSTDHIPPRILIWGGEPTIHLPDNPGVGGRNQSLALAIAKHISGASNITVLVAGTDGTDGPTHAAGGIVDGSIWTATAQDYLDAADAGSYLKQNNALFITGPTHTNVMDLVIALVD